MYGLIGFSVLEHSATGGDKHIIGIYAGVLLPGFCRVNAEAFRLVRVSAEHEQRRQEVIAIAIAFRPGLLQLAN